MDRLIKPDQQFLDLLFIKGQRNCSKTFKLTNLMHTMSVAISLTSSNPSLFSFSNPYSIIPALSTASFTLFLTNPSDQPPISTSPATVLVRTSVLPTGKARQDDLRRLFSRPGPHIMKDATIPILFTGPYVAEFLLSSLPNSIDSDFIFQKAVSSCDKSQLNYLLKIAVVNGRPEFISSLIRAGADVNCRDSNGESVMSLAIKSGKIESVQILIESDFKIDNEIDRFLHDTTILNRVDLMEILYSAYPDIDPNTINSNGQTALHIAAIQGHVESIEFLIVSLGSNPDIAEAVNWNTPLHYAANEGHLEVVKCLLNHSIFAKYAITKEGQTAFALAVQKGNSDLYDLLHLGDLLHRAARVNDVGAMKFLLVQGAKVNERDQNGWTPLHRAAFKGHMDSVKLLVGNGADVDLVDDTGYTPLRWAVEAGHVEVAMYLLSHGAKASLKGLKGIVPFDLDGLKHYYLSIVNSLHQEKLETITFYH